MSKIKISELFYSIQGEGRYMGVPSVFLRTFGCNFKCPGFGLPLGEKTTEVDAIANRIVEFKTYNDLPLVSTGCDSYASWDPRFKDLSPLMEVNGLVEEIMEILPDHRWHDEHLVITGGEPLLGWQRSYPALLDHAMMADLKELTFETNGTQNLSKDFRHYLLDWTLNPRGGKAFGGKGPRGREALTFSVSAKLPCSGEAWEDAIRPDVVMEYQDIGFTYLKLVVATEQDIEHAKQAVAEYRAVGFEGPVYLMPIGGVESVYTLNNRTVAEHAMRLGWRYSDRLHIPLWKNAWGT